MLISSCSSLLFYFMENIKENKLQFIDIQKLAVKNNELLTKIVKAFYLTKANVYLTLVYLQLLL